MIILISNTYSFIVVLGGCTMLLKQIEYLQAVIETGSFYKAAEKCHVTQSAISQQIKKLEEELGVKLLDRHNRTFSLTQAGQRFYRKSLFVLNDVEQMIKETKKIADNNHIVFRIGCYKGYHGKELSKAISEFSNTYPTIEVNIIVASHDELYRAMESDTVDLVLNDQRRAFSDVYHNEILSKSRMYIEISNRNPLSKLDSIEISELKNVPCILVINSTGQQEEQNYYEDIVGIQGDFVFATSMQEARLKIATGQGYMPVDVIGDSKWMDTSVERILLERNGKPIEKVYCAFYRKDHTEYYMEEFVKMLKQYF